MAKRGPKGKHKQDKITLEQVELLAGAGFTEKEIIIGLNIEQSTLTKWKQNKKNNKLITALKRGKITPNSKVAKSLYIRATGFDYEEVQKEYKANGKLKSSKTTTKKVLPEVIAQIFWLKNRRPDLWRDKTDIEHTLKPFLHPEFEHKSLEEIQKEADELAGKIVASRQGIKIPTAS